MFASSHLVFSFLDLKGSYLNDEFWIIVVCLIEAVYEWEALSAQLFCYLESMCTDSFYVVVT